MQTSRSRYFGILAALALCVQIGACSSENDSTNANQNGHDEIGHGGGATSREPPDGQEHQSDTSSAGGDYAFGTNRDQIAEAVGTAYASRQAKVHWEGDTMIVEMEGEADGPMAGASDCRVITEMVQDTDEVEIRFPGGTVVCSDII